MRDIDEKKLFIICVFVILKVNKFFYAVTCCYEFFKRNQVSWEPIPSDRVVDKRDFENIAIYIPGDIGQGSREIYSE